jgi:hypothetical protein
VTIDEYLAELARRLPRLRRRRFLAEAEEHLRDAATVNRQRGLAASEAEQAAVESFGDVSVVARGFASEAAVWETRVAAALALGAALSFVIPLYVVPENTLPPATWLEKPDDILVLQILSVALWCSAGTLAAASALVAWTRWSRFVAPALGLVAAAIASAMVVSAVLVARWSVVLDVTPAWPLLAAPLAIGCLAVCAQAAGWAHSRRCRLVRD